jgi:HEPN domain-containing protein
VDYYINACEQLEGAKILAASKMYRLAVTLLCLSGEMFLKSLVERKDPMNPLLNSHDIVNLGNLIRNDINYESIAPKLSFLRKYLNDSRYPFDLNVYTEMLYLECLDSIVMIQLAIDSVNIGKSDMELLKEKYGNNNVIHKTNW